MYCGRAACAPGNVNPAFNRQQLPHEGFFLLLAVGEQLFGGGDGLIPDGQDLDDFLLIGIWRNRYFQLFKVR